MSTIEQIVGPLAVKQEPNPEHVDMALLRFSGILAHVEYKDWTFRLIRKQDNLFLQLVWDAPDNLTGEPAEQKSRKWYLSPYMSQTEFLNTCLLAVKVAEEHETRELFQVEGVSPYNSHISNKQLRILDREQDYDHRYNPKLL